MKETGRNDSCPCGSGKEYMQCCQQHENPAVSDTIAATETPTALQAALEHHRAGRLPQAQAIYRQILETEPDYADALHYLGAIAFHDGKHRDAAELIGQATRLKPSRTMHYNLGNALKALGDLDGAAESYRHALALKPDYAEAHINLGNALRTQGKLDEAVGHYRSALLSRPDLADTHVNLGNALRELGKLDEAVESYQRALALKPDLAEVHYRLGQSFMDQGKSDDAALSYGKALALKPDYAEAQGKLGNVLQAQGKLDEAVENYQRALALRPDLIDAHINLGKALMEQDNPGAAISSYRKALALKPDHAETYVNIGNVLYDQGNLDDALENFRKALTFNPDLAQAYYNMGNTLYAQNKLSQAAESFRRTIALRPDFADAHNNLGLVLQRQGAFDMAITSYRNALALRPDYAEAYSNLLFSYAYQALLDPHEYLAQARSWELCLTAQDRQAARGRIFRRPPLAGRRLKVGYVSGDFRQHAVSFFVEQLFTHHDRTRVELFAYSSHGAHDAVTEQLQSLMEHWVNIEKITDTKTRDRIEADGIDVLIDLSGHTAHNRLGVFARRAAPVQAYYLGYFASTGLTEMDYWIGDETLTPPETDSHFSEQVWRLPRISMSYTGKAGTPLPGWQPDQSGAVRVGSFNNLGKLTPATLELWAKVLHALPEARLLLKAKELADAGNRQRILTVMSGHGISPDHIELQDWSVTPDRPSHMAYYDRLDIALDPVGGHGGVTTTCDALWMSVPVITLMGDRVTSRMTGSMLDTLGHPEWIAHSEAEYIDKVVALAKNVEQRKALRATQRERMAHSPLCDARGLAACMENAYFEMFERWQERKNGRPPV